MEPPDWLLVTSTNQIVIQILGNNNFRNYLQFVKRETGLQFYSILFGNKEGG